MEGSQRHSGAKPGGDLPVGEAGRVELRLADRNDRDTHEVPQLERRIGGDVDPLDRERPVEPDPPQRPVRLLAEVAARSLVEGHGDRRRAMRAQPDEREAAPEVPAKHR